MPGSDTFKRLSVIKSGGRDDTERECSAEQDSIAT
jgi:hypothetical protein